jgi:hypothetical protein
MRARRLSSTYRQTGSIFVTIADRCGGVEVGGSIFGERVKGDIVCPGVGVIRATKPIAQRISISTDKHGMAGFAWSSFVAA